MLPSLRLGKYIAEGLLGPGGVTETYLAHLAPDAQGESVKESSGKIFALKLLRSDCIAPGEYAKVAKRFSAAGRRLRDFHRPGFAKIVDLSEDPAATFIVTEHVAGCDLARLVEQSRGGRANGAVVDPLLAGIIGSEIARLLHVGHSAKPILCHLGLAPQNVVLTEAGEVVLLDSGIAACLRAVTAQPAERWSFVAPELRGVDATEAGLSERQGVAADLYALGALVHFLVTGHAPAVVPASRIRQARTTLTDIPGVSSNLGAALRTLLSSEPEDRPESAAVLVDWLAGGVDAARDRRRLIAEGVRATESGASPVSQSLPAVHAQPPREPPPIKTPSPLGNKATGGRVVKTVAAIAPARRRGLAVGVALAALLAVAGLVALATAHHWPGRMQSSRIRDRGQGSHASVEMPVAPKSGGEPTLAEGSEEPNPGQTALGESVLSRVAGHLVVETVPPGAAVWVDGVIKGKTFADIAVGEGGHRIVLIAPGHRMFLDVVDTSRGAIVRRALVPIEPPTRGNGSIAVECRTIGKFPIVLDEEETGLLCPTKSMPTSAGKHMVGIFVPHERRTVLVETTVAMGAKPAIVTFSQ